MWDPTSPSAVDVAHGEPARCGERGGVCEAMGRREDEQGSRKLQREIAHDEVACSDQDPVNHNGARKPSTGVCVFIFPVAMLSGLEFTRGFEPSHNRHHNGCIASGTRAGLAIFPHYCDSFILLLRFLRNEEIVSIPGF